MQIIMVHNCVCWTYVTNTNLNSIGECLNDRPCPRGKVGVLHGAFGVEEVTPGGAAERAGIRPGMWIKRICFGCVTDGSVSTSAQ